MNRREFLAATLAAKAAGAVPVIATAQEGPDGPPQDRDIDPGSFPDPLDDPASMAPDPGGLHLSLGDESYLKRHYAKVANDAFLIGGVAGGLTAAGAAIASPAPPFAIGIGIAGGMMIAGMAVGGWYYQGLANDPANPDYTTIVHPHVRTITVPGWLSTGLDPMLMQLERSRASHAALLDTIERWKAAVDDNDTHWAGQPSVHGAALMQECAGRLYIVADMVRAWAQFLLGSGMVVNTQPVYSGSSLAALVAANLAYMGYPAAEVADCAAWLSSIPMPVNGSSLSDIADRFDASADTWVASW